MLVCTLDGDLYPPLEEPTGTDPKSKKKDKDKDKKFVWNHGSKSETLFTSFLICLCWKLQQILNRSLPSKADLAIFDFTESVVLVPSHLPTEEHTQEKISEDCKKEGFDIFISLLSRLLHCPIHLFSILSDDPLHF